MHHSHVNCITIIKGTARIKMDGKASKHRNKSHNCDRLDETFGAVKHEIELNYIQQKRSERRV